MLFRSHLSHENRIAELEEKDMISREVAEKIILTLQIQNKTSIMQTEYLEVLNRRLGKVERLVIDLYARLEEPESEVVKHE